MTTDEGRPSTDCGRKPQSRFLEGSMNDRISAVPPSHFLGFGREEEEFIGNYSETNLITGYPKRAKKERPLSAQAQLQGSGYGLGLPNASIGAPSSRVNGNENTSANDTEARRIGFFGRVREKLLGKSSKSSLRNEAAKRSSLQEHMMRQQAPQSNGLAGLGNLSNVVGSNDTEGRPNRDEIMESYKQLMASGFFQAHAIQGSRHGAPGLGQRGRSYPPTQLGGPPSEQLLGKSFKERQDVMLPPPTRLPPPPPSPQSPERCVPQVAVQEKMTHAIPIPITIASRKPTIDQDVELLATSLPPPRPSFSSFFSGANSESRPGSSSGFSARYQLRGKKRGRSDENMEETSSDATGFRPLKKVAKKLRKMPSRVAGTNAGDPADTDKDRDCTQAHLQHDVPFKTDGHGSEMTIRKIRSMRSDINDPQPRGRRSFSNGLNKLKKRGKSPAAARAPNTLYVHPNVQVGSSSNTAVNVVNTPHGDGNDVDMVDVFPYPAAERALCVDKASFAATNRDKRGSYICEPLWAREAEREKEAERKRGLAIMPDVNRGIPTVPRIPSYFKKPGEAGYGGVKEGEIENCDGMLIIGEAI